MVEVRELARDRLAQWGDPVQAHILIDTRADRILCRLSNYVRSRRIADALGQIHALQTLAFDRHDPDLGRHDACGGSACGQHIIRLNQEMVNTTNLYFYPALQILTAP